ncbi:TM2 domain-containing protein [uncultured Tessaracoccus sp.]|uniref:TM2 domain-containing protein n=1 Tax=uncultured Tessaracoccus sp. TaxID=905023 RepID=UPI002608CA32|nr:TM2 domain-containing protein [uncultured Tessaracoccus sp.]
MSSNPYDDPYASSEEQDAWDDVDSVESDPETEATAPYTDNSAPEPTPTPSPTPAPAAPPQFEMPAPPSGFQEPMPRGPEPVAPYAAGYTDPMGQPLQAHSDASVAMPQPYAPQPYASQPGYDPSAPPPYGYAAQPGPYSNMAPSTKSKVAAGLLAIFLGAFGIHNFYLGYTGKAITQLLITVLSFGFLAFISSIWGIVEGIMILTASPGSSASRDARGGILQ